MRVAILILALLYQFLLNGQNLIPNPGFDIISNCPDDKGQIHLAEPWVNVSFDGTPDLFNICSVADRISPPNSGHYLDSYQVQQSGGGYASIAVYHNANVIGLEYMGTPLTSRLNNGETYYLEFYVSPDLDPQNYWRYTDAIGLALTDSFYYEVVEPHSAMSLEPVIENRGTLITDTVGWTRINGCHVSDGTEQFAIIGNFRNDSETLIEVENPNSFPYNNFFYIEDVLISPFNPFPDTLLLCKGSVLELNASFLDATYLWNVGFTDSILLVSESGIYSVEASIEDCILRDTVVVISEDVVSNFPSDTVICKKDFFVLEAPLPGEYNWSNGSESSFLPIQASGNYNLMIRNECGEFNYISSIEMIDCVCDILVPTGFTPNNDGINDNLEVFPDCDYEMDILKFDVFNRWGNLIYSLEGEKEIFWDGTQSGKLLEIGVYVWFMEYEFYENGEVSQVSKSGNVTIVR